MSLIPVFVPISGTTDANGILVIDKYLPLGRYYMIRAVASCTGNAAWKLQRQGDNVDFGLGPTVTLGPATIFGGEKIRIFITDATPNTPVQGSLIGASSTDVSEVTVLPLGNSARVSVAASTINPVWLFPSGIPAVPPNNIHSFRVLAASGTHSEFFTFPVGANAIRIVASNITNGLPFTYNMVVTDSSYQIQYWPNGPYLTPATPLHPSRPVIVPIDTAWVVVTDNKIIAINVVGDPAVDLDFFVSAVYDTGSVDITSQQAIDVNIGSGSTVSIAGTVPVSGTVAVSSVAGTVATQAISTPAIWQAPTTEIDVIETTGAFPRTLRAGVAGQIIRVWGWQFEADQNAAKRFVNLRGTSSAVNRGFACAWLGGQEDRNGFAGGIPLATGDALLLDSTAINGETIRCGVGISQG